MHNNMTSQAQAEAKHYRFLDPLGKLFPSWTKQLILPPFDNREVEQIIRTLHRDDEAGIQCYYLQYEIW